MESAALEAKVKVAHLIICDALAQLFHVELSYSKVADCMAAWAPAHPLTRPDSAYFASHGVAGTACVDCRMVEAKLLASLERLSHVLRSIRDAGLAICAMSIEEALACARHTTERLHACMSMWVHV